MLERAHDAGFEKGDWVWAKLTQIRNDGKLNFSIKEVDQNNGQDLNQEHTDKLIQQAYGDEMVETGEVDHRGQKIRVPRSEVKDTSQRLVGGIKVDFKEA